MDKVKDNIELRSDKVRSIIGQIPPWIIRRGISVVLLIIFALLMGSYYFKYPYIITTKVKFTKVDDTFVGLTEIPANEISKIKKGQEVEIYFSNVENVNGLQFKSKLITISKNLTILNKKGFYVARIAKIENLNINENTEGIAKISTGNISFFKRMIKSFSVLKKE